MATLCANDQCPNPNEIDENSAPILMTLQGDPPRFFCSDGCVGEFVLQEAVTRGHLSQKMLDSYRTERRKWPIP